MKKSKVFGLTLFITSLIIILTIMIGPFFRANIVRGAEQTSNKSYLSLAVDSNDTLWDIANEHMNRDYYDHELFIREVVQINNIQNSKIYAGQSIIIPIIESHQ